MSKNIYYRRCDYIQSRNSNLRREFLARLGQNGMTLDRIYKALSSDTPADRFYISEERAYRLLRFGIRNASPHPHGNPLPQKLRMLAEIRRRVNALMEADPGLSLRDAVFEVVNSPAPAFYLTPSSIKTILFRSRA